MKAKRMNMYLDEDTLADLDRLMLAMRAMSRSEVIRRLVAEAAARLEEKQEES